MHYIKKIFARQLRKEQTAEERIIWELLRDRRYMNLKFRRQHDIDGFIVDFYCHEARLVVEIDGKIHDKQKDYDLLRQSLIEEKGIRVVRITNEEVNTDVGAVLKKIGAFAMM